MDTVFQSLAHKARRRILDIVRDRPGCTVGDVAREFDVTRFAIMKHLTVLEDAGLLVSEKVGRQKKLYFNVIPIQMIYDRWTDEYSAYWAGQMTGIKYRAEKRVKKGVKE